MRRIWSVVAVAATMAAMMVAFSVPAIAGGNEPVEVNGQRVNYGGYGGYSNTDGGGNGPVEVMGQRNGYNGYGGYSNTDGYNGAGL